MNCGHPFFGHEKFCPECGQKNKGRQITFSSFVKEIFNGFISWDAKFWTTLFPLLTKPGKVSKDFINGKRQRYSNPFQFYLTVSILFFLIVGLTNKYQEFQELSSGQVQKSSTLSFMNNSNGNSENNTNIDVDSISKTFQGDINNALKDLDSTEREQALKFIAANVLDSIQSNDNRSMINVSDNDGDVGKMMKFRRENPTATANQALDSLKMKKSFWNRFLYSKAEVFNSFQEDTQKANEEFTQELISYASISLFIFLPIFTLFLKFIYIRRKFTYVEHLIFVFHTQTVFFILLTIFFLISLFAANNNITAVFVGLFLIYLFIAMKKFYQQGYIKTFFKFLILNSTYMFLGTIGFVIVAAVAFALY